MIEFQYNDGGREAAGYKGSAGDCAVRATAIATGLGYKTVYDGLFKAGKQYSENNRDRVAKDISRNGASPRNGVWREVLNAYLASLGWVWVPVMKVGSGCQMRLRSDEVPNDQQIIVRLSRHYAAVCWGTLHDTYDSSRDGTRCVYGYWKRGD